MGNQIHNLASEREASRKFTRWHFLPFVIGLAHFYLTILSMRFGKVIEYTASAAFILNAGFVLYLKFKEPKLHHPIKAFFLISCAAYLIPNIIVFYLVIFSYSQELSVHILESHRHWIEIMTAIDFLHLQNFNWSWPADKIKFIGIFGYFIYSASVFTCASFISSLALTGPVVSLYGADKNAYHWVILAVLAIITGLPFCFASFGVMISPPSDSFTISKPFRIVVLYWGIYFPATGIALILSGAGYLRQLMTEKSN